MSTIDPNEAQSFLAAIIESSDDAIISKRLDGTIISWNAAAEKLFGYTADEAVGQNIIMLIPEDKRDEEFVIIGKIKSGQKVEHFETVRRRKDGKPVDISLTVSPIRDGSGTIVGASKMARDIRAAKEAEKISSHLAAIVDSSDDAIIGKKLDGTITSWNGAAERIFGYAPEEAIGQHISLLIPPDKMDEEYAIIGKVKEGHRVDHFETIRRRKDGQLINISLTVSPIRDKHGNIVGASKVARDITGQKATETALREANQRKDDFLANMSHELRTPMNAVIGLANLLAMSSSLTTKEQQYVATLRQSADSLMSLINSLLDFSKLESGSLDLEHTEFSLADVLEKVISITNVSAKEKILPLRLHYKSPLRKYYLGDALRLEQILLNLLSNAIKFTEKGSVDITVSGQEGANGKSAVSIDVSDTGIGIPEDRLDAIFDKFVQADSSTTRRYGGTGLGLSICREIVGKMGGAISVRSRIGLGTTFTVSLPLQNAPRHSLIEPVEVSSRQVKKNVLIVDDYEPNILVITAMLDRMGYDYDIAEDGVAAMRKYQNGSYDVVLMDVQMPNMDGFESSRRIRAFEKSRGLKRTPIVAITAHVLEKDRKKCIEAGMDDFIPKPFDPSDLERTLKEMIAMKLAS